MRQEERLKRVFPAYFSRFELPEGAREEAIEVYRACKSGKCDAASFIPTYEEKGFEIRDGDDEKDPGLYSLSTFEKPQHVKRFAKVDVDTQIPCRIAVGITEPKWGLVQRTSERKKKAKSHVDWWLYENATPHESFELILDFEEFLKKYKAEHDKERDENNVQIR